MPKRRLQRSWLAALVAGLLALAACGRSGRQAAPPGAAAPGAAATSHAAASPSAAPAPGAQGAPSASQAGASQAQDSDSGPDASAGTLETPDGQPATMDEDAYLNQYRALAGVKTLPSGIMYFVNKSGHGKSPSLKDRVRLFYGCTLMNNAVCAGMKPNQTEDYAIADLAQGWQQVLLNMKEGDEWEVVVPSDLSYDGKAAPGVKPGSSPGVLRIYDVTLVKVLPRA